MIDPWLLAFRVVIHVGYLFDDWRDSRWLPTWRRYAPSLCLVPGTVAIVIDNKPLGGAAFVAWLVAFIANWITASRNRRNKRDMRKVEAEAKLTPVQQQAFARECVEVRS